MKLSQVLYKQSIGRYFRQHWDVQGKKKVFDSGAEDILKSNGVTVQKAEDFLYERKAPDAYEFPVQDVY